MNDNDIDEMVVLLAFFKMQKNETIHDVKVQLLNTGAFNQKQLKKIIVNLKTKQYIINDNLSFSGIQKANEAQRFFKI